jgi:peptidoglycan/LPS O-acetylase OafA/YrhL
MAVTVPLNAGQAMLQGDRPGRSLTSSTARALDTTRWIAAGLVVLYHIRFNVMVDHTAVAADAAPPWLVWTWYRITDCGPQAVFWFFVISGFLIGGKVIDDIQHDRFRLGAFLIARVSRLYVVLLPALVLGYGMDLLRLESFGLSVDAGSETVASYTPLTIMANLLCLQTIIAPTLGSNLPLWSLACEAWYYLLFPLILLGVMPRQPRRQRLLALLATAAIVGLLAGNPKVLAFFSFWLLGAAVSVCPYVLTRSRLLPTVSAIAAVLVYPTLETSAPMKVLAMVLVTATFANLLLTIRNAPPQPAPRSVGAWNGRLASFSYSLYVSHAPLLHLILTSLRGAANPRLYLQPEGWLPTIWTLGLVVVLYGYAWVFSRFTEAHTAEARSVLHNVIASARIALAG